MRAIAMSQSLPESVGGGSHEKQEVVPLVRREYAGAAFRRAPSNLHRKNLEDAVAMDELSPSGTLGEAYCHSSPGMVLSPDISLRDRYCSSTGQRSSSRLASGNTVFFVQSLKLTSYLRCECSIRGYYRSDCWHPVGLVISYGPF